MDNFDEGAHLIILCPLLVTMCRALWCLSTYVYALTLLDKLGSPLFEGRSSEMAAMT